MASEPPKEGQKVSKESVNYQTAVPNAPKRCGTCSMYLPSGTCMLVEGRIRRIDVCDKWEKKRR